MSTLFRLRHPRAGATLVGCLLLLVWLTYNSLIAPVEKQEARVLLERERKRCLFKQGADPGGHLSDSSAHSEFRCAPGRYPSGLCTVSLLYLNHSERQFVARAKGQHASRLNSELGTLQWPITARPHDWPNCTEYFDEAFIFTVEDSNGDDQYFKLHMTTFVPLFSLMAYREHLGPPTRPGYSMALMPAVEDYSLQTVDWETKAFLDTKRFGAMQQMLQVFAGHAVVKPLVAGHRHDSTVTCIRLAHFGVGSINSSDPELLTSFSAFIQAQLGLPLPLPQPTEPLVCLAKRYGDLVSQENFCINTESFNRRILNEDGLISAVSKFVRIQTVQFDAISYSDQVAEMHQYTILVGFHGDELLNSLYMPVGSVTIQLVPYNARSLDTERYAQVLRAHGPYLEWHNQHEKNSRPNQVDDSDNRLADTLVPVEEFVSLVKQALILGINSRLVQFQSP